MRERLVTFSMLTEVIVSISTSTSSVVTTLTLPCWILCVTKDGSFHSVYPPVRRYNPLLRRIWIFYCLHRFTRSGHVNPYPPLPANVSSWDSWFVGKQSWVEKNTSEMVPWQRKGNQGEVTKYLRNSLRLFREFPMSVIYDYLVTKNHSKYRHIKVMRFWAQRLSIWMLLGNLACHDDDKLT